MAEEQWTFARAVGVVAIVVLMLVAVALSIAVANARGIDREGLGVRAAPIRWEMNARVG